MQAVEGAHRRVIPVLLECGANAGACNKAGKTALHLAVRHPNGKERNRLAEAVLSVSPRSWQGMQTQIRNCQQSCSADLLQAVRQSLWFLQAASSPSTLIAAVDDDGNTPLDLAVNPSVKATLEVNRHDLQDLVLLMAERSTCALNLAPVCNLCRLLRPQKYAVAGVKDAFEEERQRAAARTSVKRQAELAAVVDEQSWWVVHASPLLRPGGLVLATEAVGRQLKGIAMVPLLLSAQCAGRTRSGMGRGPSRWCGLAPQSCRSTHASTTC